MKSILKQSLILVTMALFISGLFLITACSKKTDLTFGMGKRMALAFEANPTTGFSWAYTVANDINNGELKLISEDYESNDKSGTLIGGGGHTTYVFEAVKPGKQSLRFVYRRPWEGGENAYDVVYELEIDKDLNIICLSKMKGIIQSDKDLGSFPNPTFE